MDPFDHNLLDRDLNEALGGDGPDPQLKARIIGAMKPGQSTRRPSGRVMPMPVKRTPWGTYVAAAAALVIAVVVFGWAMTQPPAPTPVKQEPVSEKRPLEKPEIGPPRNETPEQPPQPESQTPKDPVEHDGLPAPEPRPKEKPEPEPENPAPEPAKPDDVVDKPEPQPDPAPEKPNTKATPTERKVVALVATDAKLKYRSTADGEWLKLEDGEVLQGWQLKADAPADLTLVSGACIRFEGELVLNLGEVDLLGRRTEFYVDSLGIEGELSIVRAGLAVNVADAEAMFEAAGNAIETWCFEGKAGEAPAGRYAKLSARGWSSERDIKASERAPRLLKGMPQRRLFFHDHAESCKGENSSITLKLEREIVNVAGAELRLRFKPANAGALYVQAQQQAGKLQWGKWLPLARTGEWLEWSIPLAELQRDDGAEPGAPMQTGDKFATINIFIQDGKQAELEIGRVEIVRVRKE